MELHQALKQIINTDGQDILTQLRVVNILSDLQAYQKIPAAKYIIASMINDGFMLKLLNLGTWNAKSEQLANQFVQITGFQEDMVSVIFQSIAYGVGWKNQVEIPSKPRKKAQPKPKRRPKTAEDLVDLIEINPNVQSLLGVTLSGFSIDCIMTSSDAYYIVNCELTKSGNTKKTSWNYIIMAFYDDNGRIRLSKELFSGRKIPTYETLSWTWSVNKSFTPSNVSRIVVYAKEND